MRWFLIALLGFAAGCTSTAAQPPPRAAVASLHSPTASFKEYQTFAFGSANPPAAGYEVTARSLEVQRRLTPLVESSLRKMGYQRADSGADLVVKISTGSGRILDDVPQRGNAPPSVAAGFIGLDFYDAANGAAVWHGIGYAEIDPEKIDEALLAMGVQHLLADFPARTTSTQQALSP